MNEHPAPHAAPSTSTYDTIVIGGGQAGLAAGYHLQQVGRSFVILDAHDRVGDAWRTRWESLVLFTPAHLNHLPGMRYPAPAGTFSTKDEFADYLEAYATRFALPVVNGARVERLSKVGGRFRVRASSGTYEATNVVVATGAQQRARTPAFAADLDASINQLHSSAFRDERDLQPGSVLIVGVGNSGADIGMDLVQQREVTLAGNPPGVIPFRIEPAFAKFVLLRVVRFVGMRVLNVRNPIGRKVGPTFTSKGTPLIRHKPKDLVAAGITRTARITGVRNGKPVTEDGLVIDAANVIWATGYRHAFQWIDLPVLGEGGAPEQNMGVVASCPGLYFLGLEMQTSATSGTITGLRRDAKRIVRILDRRSPAGSRAQRSGVTTAA